MRYRLISTAQLNTASSWMFKEFSGETEEINEKLHALPYPLVELSTIASVSRGSARPQGDLREGIRVLSATDIQSGPIGSGGRIRFITTEEHEQRMHSAVKRGDILLRLVGSADSTVAIHYNVDEPANLTSHIARIEVDRFQILPEYLVLYLNSDLGRSSISQLMTGTTIAMMSLQSVNQLAIPLPSLQEQERIVSSRLALIEEADRKEQEAKDLRDKYYRLFSEDVE